MTEKANPSINAPAKAFKVAGAIAYGGNEDGFIIESNNPTQIAIQDSDINENNLEAFDESTTGSSLDAIIDGGEAFVFGSWLCIDTQTTVTLAADTSGQEVYVGWNKDGTDDVIVGLDTAFSEASGDADQKVPLWSFDTDANGVDAIQDLRSFDHIAADSVAQGPGSGFDADTVDGIEGSEIGSIFSSVTSETGNYTASNGDLVLADASTSAFSVILPSPEAGEIVSVKKTDSTTNPVTIATPASETIDGQSAISINTQFESRNVISDGSNYFVV